MSRIIVVGGGIAGLAAAARLAHQGHQVTLIEQRAELGGRISQIRHKGFRFDAGPTF